MRVLTAQVTIGSRGSVATRQPLNTRCEHVRAQSIAVIQTSVQPAPHRATSDRHSDRMEGVIASTVPARQLEAVRGLDVLPPSR